MNSPTLNDIGLSSNIPSSAPTTAQLIAFYLPQFHPIPENDEWWGKGFTEWTNVTKARPQFPGHYQPHYPADLGYYDLRLPEARQAQADLAKEYGIHGFCYYHYWFNGRRLLERPFNDVLASGEPDLPFCLCWANENWTRNWDGQEKQILLEQKYSKEDDIAHIRSLLHAFADPRYIRVNDKPLFLVYGASRLPDPQATTDRWRREVERAGLGGIFLCRVDSFHEYPLADPRSLGFDASVGFEPAGVRKQAVVSHREELFWSHKARIKEKSNRLLRRDNTPLPPSLRQIPDFTHIVQEYETVVESAMAQVPPEYPHFPCVCPSWDNSARRKENAVILRHSTPEKYQGWLLNKLTEARRNQKAFLSDDAPSAIVFINAWNEWAEGNHLEPDQKWGHKYLEATREALNQFNGKTS